MSAVLQNFKKGDALFAEGQPSTHMFIIQKGSVAIRKRKGSGYIEIARIFSNETIGELSFFDRKPRSASAVALTDVEALVIDFVSLEKSFEKIPDYFKTIVKSLAERLRKADDMIRKISTTAILEDGTAGRTGEKSEEEVATDDVLKRIEDDLNKIGKP